MRRVRECLIKAAATLETDNTYALELDNGSRVLALPGTDDTVRGLTVDAWIVADEAARLTADLIAALRPMRARKPEARLAMLSTAWRRTDPFWQAWAGEDSNWIRLKVTADEHPELFAPDFLAQERIALGAQDYERKYLGVPTSPFEGSLFECATQIRNPRAPLGRAFRPAPQAPAARNPNPFQQLQQN